MSKQSASLLIVEDEPGIAELLRYTMIAAGFSIDIVGTAQAARQSLANVLPQAVLLDWMLPDVPGITLVQEWRNDARTTMLPIIMLTAKGLDEDKVRGLNAGADDYVTKPFSPRELVARINAVLRRQSPHQDADQHSIGAIVLDDKRHVVLVDGVAVELGPIEFKLLRFMMNHPERIFSRTQLLDHVWGDHAFLEERTVDVHIMRLRKSLGASVDCIKTIRSVGYMLKAEMPD